MNRSITNSPSTLKVTHHQRYPLGAQE
jgi:hypothetical protein